MSRLDTKLCIKAKNEEYQLPEEIRQSVDDVLEGLPEKTVKTRYSRHMWKYIATAALVAIIIILPNVNVSVAYALERIPVVGNVVKVVTIRNYMYKDGNMELHIKKPWISESQYMDGTDEINKNIEKMTNEILEKYQSDLALYGEDAHMYKCVDYKTVSNNDRWFTLCLMVTETASSNYTNNVYYNLDKKSGEIVSFDELFKEDGKYKTIIQDEIKKQMTEQMKDDELKNYWINAENPKWDYMELGKNTQYYVSSEGQLVVVFEQGQVGPYSMGIPEFIIPTEIIRNCISEQYIDIFNE